MNAHRLIFASWIRTVTRSSNEQRAACWVLAILFCGAAQAQPPSTNPPPKVYRGKVEAHWFAKDSKFWYRNDLPGGEREFILVDAEKGVRQPAFDHARAAGALAAVPSGTNRIGLAAISSLQFSDDEQTVTLIGEKAWTLRLDNYSLTETSATMPAKEADSKRGRREDADAKPQTLSPDGKWEALVRGHNLFVREKATGKDRRLTHDGNPTYGYTRSNQGERMVGLRYAEADPSTPAPEVYWSPDSTRLVAMKTRLGTERTVYLVESSPADQLQPKLQSYPYAKPGDDIAVTIPQLFELETGREIPVRDDLFAHPWAIDQVSWAKDSSRFTFLYNQRGHQALRILAVDARSGACRAIVNEESATFINYSGKFFADSLEDSSEIIWMSERDGWNHLYLYDAVSGAVKNQITRGDWVVRGVERVDREKRQIWFRASGLRYGENPYYLHLCRVNFDGTGLVILTKGDGTHSVEFSPDRRFMIDTWSRIDQPPTIELRSAVDGAFICGLEEADASEAAREGVIRQEFVAKGRDGQTDIYGVIHRPAKLAANRKYPIIESIYAGPHDSFVPAAYRASFFVDPLVKRGFVVVQMDGMGTSNRSKKFHDVCWKNLGDAGFPDRVLWIQAAAKEFPWMDLERVGIFGTSAGGQSALRGLLMHGDFYKAGIADCGCHDNRMDKIWWNEQWMGPVGPHYEEQSNVTQAHRLKGKLLLMVGELDKNVDPASTMQVVDALIKADKDFELLVMPGVGHGAARTPYGARRLIEFFVRAFQASAP